MTLLRGYRQSHDDASGLAARRYRWGAYTPTPLATTPKSLHAPGWQVKINT